MSEFSACLMLFLWMAGIVLAKGWMTVVAVFVPFYAWYLVAELVMRKMGLV